MGAIIPGRRKPTPTGPIMMRPVSAAPRWWACSQAEPVRTYGLVDMSGYVREWTRSFGYDVLNYPCDPKDGREDLSWEDVSRALRGGSFDNL